MGEPDPAARAVVDRCRAAGLTLGCAESLTGGLLAATVVTVPGASDVLRGGVVAYAADVKATVLGVDRALLERVGTVDEGVAVQMAEGARRVLPCAIAVATTGVAGPGPSEGHPAGTVWVAVVGPSGTTTRRLALSGDRAEIRSATVDAALALVRAVTDPGAPSAPEGTVGHTPTRDDEGEEGEP